jgi:hypothetical protein
MRRIILKAGKGKINNNEDRKAVSLWNLFGAQ